MCVCGGVGVDSVEVSGSSKSMLFLLWVVAFLVSFVDFSCGFLNLNAVLISVR